MLRLIGMRDALLDAVVGEKPGEVIGDGGAPARRPPRARQLHRAAVGGLDPLEEIRQPRVRGLLHACRIKAVVQISRRLTSDPGGKPVDVYPENHYLSGIFFDDTGLICKDAVRTLLLDYLERLARSPSSKRRTRRFSIFYGKHVNRLGDRSVVIGLPDRFDRNLHIEINRELSKIAKIVELGRVAAAEIGGEPLLRYEYGDLVAYADPFLSVGDLSFRRGVELRSYDHARKPEPRKKRRYSLPVTATRDSLLHSIESWERGRLDIFRFIYDTIEPASFAGLKRLTTRSFGIKVAEGAADEEYRYGSIATDWVDRNQNVEVSIYVNRTIDPLLKYIVLAHELAHYVLHFPLLVLSQMVEQLSWERPVIESEYAQLASRILNKHLFQLEYQANGLASYLMVPPWLDFNQMASMICEERRSPSGAELAWRFLQHFFPDRAHITYSGANWDEMLRTADEELASAESLNESGGDSLFLSLLGAAARRGSQEVEELNRAIADELLELWYAVDELHRRAGFDLFTDGPVLQMDMGSELRNAKRIVKPKDGRSCGHRVPLVQSMEGHGKWLGVLESSLPAATITDWQQRHPASTLLLYDHMKMPTRSVWKG